MVKMWCCCFVALLSLSLGCAAPKDKVFTWSSRKNIKTIGLIRPANQVDIEFLDETAHQRLWVSPLLMVLTAGSEQLVSKQHTADLADSVTESLDFSRIYSEALLQRLTAAGFTVVLVDGLRKKPDAFAASYAPSETEVQVYLDTAVKFFGLHKGVGDEGYVPIVDVDVRLSSSPGGEPFYSAQVVARPKLSELGTNKEPDFIDNNEVVARWDEAMNGLKASIERAADLIAQDLDPNSPRIRFHRTAGVFVVAAPVKLTVGGRELYMGTDPLDVRVAPGSQRIEAIRQDGMITIDTSPLTIDAVPGKTSCVRVAHYMAEFRLLAMTDAECAEALAKASHSSH